MSKIINLRMKNKKMNTSIGVIEFDSEGVADIKNEEYVADLLELNGFELADGEKMPEKASKKEDSEVISEVEENAQETEEETEESPGELSEESLLEKNVPQLRKIAKDNGIDLAGASKKDEIIAVILGAVNQ